MDEQNWEERRERYTGRRQRARHGGGGGGSAFTGILLVTIGLIFLLGNMGYLNAGYVFRNFWPLLLIALGVKILVFHRGQSYGGGSPGIGIFWLIFGAFFLFSNLAVVPPVRMLFQTLWPFVPLAIGAFILWKVFIDREDEPRYSDSDTDDRRDSEFSSSSKIFGNASFGHILRRSNSQDFRGGRLSSFMGTCEADLRGASTAGEAILDLSAFMGGVEVRVPRDWTVVNRVSAFMGGVEDKTDPPTDESKRLVLRGSVFMGGVEVKN